ncbi:MAG TPA: hypothetical protein VFF68_02275 [Anaerolineaceae bacterium]|nr:hypothetical protein [Anaerolineaceae bacterium]
MPSKSLHTRTIIFWAALTALLLGLAACQPAAPATPPPGVPPSATPARPVQTGTPAVRTVTPVGATPTTTPAPSLTPTRDLATLPISFPIMSAEMADYFNQIARPDDSALLPVAQLRWLPNIEAGLVRVGFPAWSRAERELPALVDRIDMVSYNPEHWDQTPEEEKNNLPETVERAHNLARQHNLLLMVAPDRRFARDYLRQIAPSTDLLALQGQRIQDDPAEFEQWAREMIAIAREANPEVKIYVQVGANQGPAEEMLAAIRTIAGEIDGISIWVNPDSFETLKEFLALIRPEET